MEIQLKITSDSGEEISSPENLQLKKRPEDLCCRANKLQENPKAQVANIDTVSSSPKNTLSLAIVAYPFKNNVSGKIEQFIHTPTTPGSDPRLQNDAASYICSLKASSSSHNVEMSVGKKKDVQEKADSRKSSVQCIGQSRSLEVQPSNHLTILDTPPAMRPTSRMRSGVPVRRRNMHELVDLHRKLSMNSMRSTVGLHPLSRGSSKSSLLSESLHPLDNHAFKSSKRCYKFV